MGTVERTVNQLSQQLSEYIERGEPCPLVLAAFDQDREVIASVASRRFEEGDDDQKDTVAEMLVMAASLKAWGVVMVCDSWVRVLDSDDPATVAEALAVGGLADDPEAMDCLVTYAVERDTDQALAIVTPYRIGDRGEITWLEPKPCIGDSDRWWVTQAMTIALHEDARMGSLFVLQKLTELGHQVSVAPGTRLTT